MQFEEVGVMIDPKLKTKYFAPKLKKDYEYFAKRLKEFEKKKKITLGPWLGKNALPTKNDRDRNGSRTSGVRSMNTWKNASSHFRKSVAKLYKQFQR